MNINAFDITMAALFLVAVVLAGSIGFDAGVKRERKGWIGIAKMMLRYIEANRAERGKP